MKNLYKLFAVLVAVLQSSITAAQPGSLDTNFSTDGKLTTPIGSSVDNGYSVAIQSDGKIVYLHCTDKINSKTF